MSDPELELFKSGIDLRAYAAGQGYELDRKDSWRGTAVMRHPNGDKVIIKRDAADGHYVYFSVRDGLDNGSIIDFVQHRLRVTLGRARMELRPWVGMSPVMVPLFSELPKTAKNRRAVENAYVEMHDAHRHEYLESQRALPSELFSRPRFAGRIRIDSRRNAIFPHFDDEGLCGYEIKNSGFTGFASGGTKGLWLSHDQSDDERIIFCESAIDALSHAVLFPDDNARYASIGGKPNPIQPELIRAAIERMPVGSEVIAAMDADQDGAKLADVVREALALAGRVDCRFVIEEPLSVSDWNEQLKTLPKPTHLRRHGAHSLA